MLLRYVRRGAEAGEPGPGHIVLRAELAVQLWNVGLILLLLLIRRLR